MGRIIGYEVDFVVNTMTQLIKRQKPLPGNNKTEAAKRAAELIGWQDGMIEGLANFGNEQRRQAYLPYRMAEPNVKWIPAVESYEVTRWVNEQLKKWNDGHYKDASDETWATDIKISWSELVFNKEISEEIETRRRRLILAGQIAPEPDDAEWIREEREAYESLVKPYDNLLRQLGDVPEQRSSEH